uniref:Uncharacterized protein n=1 Tax=Setaria italica TaxID=4555 RepID=K3YFH6_SETIT
MHIAAFSSAHTTIICTCARDCSGCGRACMRLARKRTTRNAAI